MRICPYLRASRGLFKKLTTIFGNASRKTRINFKWLAPYRTTYKEPQGWSPVDLQLL